MPRHAFDSDFMAVNMLTPEERQAAGAGAEATDDSSAPTVAAEQQPQRPRQRLKSLDAVRGLNIMVMMFVDDADPFSFSIAISTMVQRRHLWTPIAWDPMYMYTPIARESLR